jgi:integrase
MNPDAGGGNTLFRFAVVTPTLKGEPLTARLSPVPVPPPGARPHEVMGAEWPRFELQRGIWTKLSHHTKQKKDEHVPLNPSAMAILQRMWKNTTGVYLFPGRDSNRARTTLKNAWRQVCKTAGFVTEYSVKGKRGKPLPRWKPTVRIYDLRHTFASHLVSRNISLYLVGRLMGHTVPSTTQRYAHCSDAALRSATNDFTEALAAGSTTFLAGDAAQGTAPALPSVPLLRLRSGA